METEAARRVEGKNVEQEEGGTKLHAFTERALQSRRIDLQREESEKEISLQTA